MKKHRRRGLILTCVCLGLLSLTACGKKKEEPKADPETWVTLDESSPMEQVEPYPMLQQILQERAAGGWGQTPPSAFGLSDALADMDKPWGYAILDLNGDGTQEMVLGWNEDGRTRLVNVFTLDADGMLDTQFCSDGLQFLSITDKGEWIMGDGTHDRLPEEPASETASPEGGRPEETARGEEGWEPSTEDLRDIQWKNIDLTALQ